MATISDVLLFLIKNGPGRNETELAEAIFGKGGYQKRVNSDCNLLLIQGKVERQGAGGQLDPYRHFPSENRIQSE